MRASNLGRPMMCWSGVLLAFAACTIVAPRAARAECSSHYTPTLSLSIGSGTLDLGAMVTPAEADKIPGPPKPCHGAMCSGRPAMPLTPAPPDLHRIGSWAILTVTNRIESPESAISRLDAGPVRPTHLPSSVFHPPRPSRSPFNP